MPTVLSDPSTTLYALVAVMVAVLGAVYAKTRKRGDLIRLVIGVAALAALFIIDRLVESPREEATRKVGELVAATKAKKADDLAKNLSDSFSWNNMNKEQFIAWAKDVMARSEFNGIDVDGLGRHDFEPVDDKKVKIGFDVWPAGYGLPEWRPYCKATFVKDPDGQFRMQTFELTKKRGDPTPFTVPQVR